MNSVRSNNISLKYQRFTTLGSKDIGIIKSEFVAKTQFLYRNMAKETLSVRTLVSSNDIITIKIDKKKFLIVKNHKKINQKKDY